MHWYNTFIHSVATDASRSEAVIIRNVVALAGCQAMPEHPRTAMMIRIRKMLPEIRVWLRLGTYISDLLNFPSGCGLACDNSRIIWPNSKKRRSEVQTV